MDKKILREKVESLNFKSKDNAESSNSSFNSKPYIYFNETLFILSFLCIKNISRL